MQAMWLEADTAEALDALVGFLGLSGAAGVSYVAHNPGSVYEQWPNGDGGTLNAVPWGSVLVDEPTFSDQAFWDGIAAKQGSARETTKPSANGNDPSKWYEWDVTGGVGRMFKESGAGAPEPARPRMRWAV